MKTSTVLTSSLVAALAAYYWGELVYRTMTVLGVFRWQVPNMYADDDIVYIEDTQHCEDVHYHDGLLYTACEDNLALRFKWFPPLGHFDEPEVATKSKGSIHVVDPNTMKSRRLEFQNFDHVSGFITHGFDIIPDPNQPSGKAVYIIAINHLPNPKWTVTSQPQTHKAKSRLEVFHHEIGSSTLRHIRSVWSPLIRTPNDVFALNATTIFVSNDHYHREGIKRMLEDINFNARYTDVVKIELDPKTLASSKFTAEEEGVTVSAAIPSIHNSNGMGHGRTDREILIASCASGILNIGQIDDNGNITLTDAIPAEIVIDNPNYFSDPYSKGSPKGGFLLPGVARPLTLAHSARDPSYEGEPKDPAMVWYVTPGKTAEKKWEQRLVFSDDGSRLRSISGSVMVAIDPATQEDKTKRQAWLFMTGFISKNMIAVKVDLNVLSRSSCLNPEGPV